MCPGQWSYATNDRLTGAPTSQLCQIAVRPGEGAPERSQALGLVAAEAMWISPDSKG